VLDLACGEGYGTYSLARVAARAIGIDVDPNVISHARHKYIRHNVEFKAGSMTHVPIEGEHIFDVIVCVEALNTSTTTKSS
jgi:2-polyprenyl-3-methyl-5-hydroxy-6-metoxy-1,4-benzoquinol methylase